jgi:DNA/RNA-binding domain of Phe-tRNA-synthetase-like protein
MKIGDIEVTLAEAGLVIGVVVARACESPNVDAAVAAAVAKAPALATLETEKKAGRDMLRFGKYKPTGRGKPASEYLLQAALENQFPRVNALVDLCNVVSLENLLPISLIDLQRAAVSAFTVRRGKAGESYIFNTGGQSIELTDLLLTARMPTDEPCANAVKDSLATKLGPDATDVVGIIYAPQSQKAACERATKQLADLYRTLSKAQVAEGVVS